MTFLRLSMLSALLSPLAPDEPEDSAPETTEQELGARATGKRACTPSPAFQPVACAPGSCS